ncbi:MAG TPA: hypothetical protein GXZ90_08845 [Clostridiales bacterium]|nr:hypothetical protein [Clostridiales bacterium]
MKKTVGTIVTMLVISVSIGAFYYYQKNRTDPPKDQNQSELKEIEIMLDKNLEKDYPATAKEAVNLYSHMTKVLHSEITDEEVELLGKKLRDFYDEELLQKNKIEDYLFDLKIDVATYRNNNKIIRSYEIDSDSIETNVIDELEYTTMNVLYRMKDNKASYSLTEKFILRKDDNGRWKILGWNVVDSKSTNDTSE